MECGEMKRSVEPEVLGDPLSHRVELGVAVVVPGDDQVGDLEPHVGLVPQVLEGVQHRPEMTHGDVLVEVVRKGLEVDVGSIHVGVELTPRLGAHVPGRHRHRLETAVWHASATSMAYSMNTTGSLYVKATVRQPRASAARAMLSGDAASASVSTSFDLGMLQFCRSGRQGCSPPCRTTAPTIRAGNY